jgi:hypothetical protein
MKYLPEVRQGKLVLKEKNGLKRRGENEKGWTYKNCAQALEGICAHDRLHLQALGLSQKLRIVQDARWGVGGHAMDTVFWIGIAIGAVLSLLASVVANLAHAKITGFLDNRKLIFLEKRKKKALELLSIIKELHDGKRDKYIYMMRLAASVVAMSVSAFTALSSAMVILGLSTPPTVPMTSTLSPEIYPRYAVILSLLFVALLSTFILGRQLGRYRTIANALNDYAAYCAEFEKRWGPT